MIVIDTSALLAVALAEADARKFAEVLNRATKVLMPAAVFLESSIVLLARKGEGGLLELNKFIHDFSINVASFDHSQARLAQDAFVRYGKGRHRAGLNFGDCMVYATARGEALPLLFKGDDFRLTDIQPAL